MVSGRPPGLSEASYRGTCPEAWATGTVMVALTGSTHGPAGAWRQRVVSLQKHRNLGQMQKRNDWNFSFVFGATHAQSESVSNPAA